MKYSSNRNRGSTIIELIVIVAIILVLTTLSVNGLSNLLQWNKLNTIAIQLRADLRLAQANAFYEGVYYKIEFYATFDCPTLNKYRIYKQTELYEEIQLEGVELFKTNFTNNNLFFYPNGVPSQGGTVTLKNNRGKVLYVIMTPVTARIRISTKPPENW
jgi:Tfp pilus assembly protein FimT